MQLETGKSKHGLVGTFTNIVKEEGYVQRQLRALILAYHDLTPLSYQALVVYIEVCVCSSCLTGLLTIRLCRAGSSIASGGAQTRSQVVRVFAFHTCVHISATLFALPTVSHGVKTT